MELFTDLYHSPYGDMKILYQSNGLVGLYFTEYFRSRFRKFDYNNNSKESQISIETKKWLDNYFNYKNPKPEDLTLRPVVTPFQQKVYKILMQQPFGTTITYGELRDKFEYTYSQRMAAQAIGGAMKRNPILIIIPCHRVISSNNRKQNFACGVENKLNLLEFERNYGNEKTKETFTKKKKSYKGS